MNAALSTQDSSCPKALGDKIEHLWLVQRMAKVAGVDLAAAMETGELSSEDWSKLVSRCRGCAWVDGCREWLDQQFTIVETTPDECVNGDEMIALRGTD